MVKGFRLRVSCTTNRNFPGKMHLGEFRLRHAFSTFSVLTPSAGAFPVAFPLHSRWRCYVVIASLAFLPFSILTARFRLSFAATFLPLLLAGMSIYAISVRTDSASFSIGGVSFNVGRIGTGSAKRRLREQYTRRRVRW